MICVSENLGRCTQTSLHFLFSCLLSSRHAELVSASHREPLLVLLRGQILKQVQDDVCTWLTTHCSSLILSKQITIKYIMNMKTFKNHPVVKFLRIILHIISLCLFSYFLYRSIKNQSPMWHKIMEIFLIVCALIDLYLDRHLFLCTKKK